jgi:hypothetical protein
MEEVGIGKSEDQIDKPVSIKSKKDISSRIRNMWD